MSIEASQSNDIEISSIGSEIQALGSNTCFEQTRFGYYFHYIWDVTVILTGERYY